MIGLKTKKTTVSVAELLARLGKHTISKACIYIIPRAGGWRDVARTAATGADEGAPKFMTRSKVAAPFCCKAHPK